MSLDRISIIPYARKKSIEFFATNLRPDREAKFFFDESPVDSFIQVASEVLLTANDATKYTTGEGIVCEATNSYSTIIKSVSPNKLFVNDNYITLKLNQYGASSLVSGTFSVGDIIYQTGNNSSVFSENTFSGRVEHWFTSNTCLVVSPLSGIANTLSSTRVIHTVTAANKANLASIQVLNKYPIGSSIKSAADAVKTSTVSSYSHRHGVVVASNTTTINLASTYAYSTQIPIKISEGSGFGQSKNVIASGIGTANTVATIDSAFITLLDNTSKYSLDLPVVDDNGNLAGIFHLPETTTARFKTGERSFAITDTTSVQSADATMRAQAKYLASGLSVDVATRTSVRSADTSTTSETITGQITVNQTTNITTSVVTNQPGSNTTPTIAEPPPEPVTPTPVSDPVRPPPTVVTTGGGDNVGTPVTVGGGTDRFTGFQIPNFNFNLGPIGLAFGDPVAQTFFTPKTGYGIFVTSVDLFFKAKPLASNEDAEIPVTVRIVSTQNGYPTDRVIATATVQCFDVKTTDGVTTFPRSSNTATQTKFTFSDPVYLNSSTEYAIVVYSDSPSYEVWLSELGESIIGDPDGRRVSEQPYIGSFFRSQNASTWTPYQNEDLMFRINRAVFDTNPVTLTFGSEKLSTAVPFDEIILNATEIEFPRANIDHKLKTTLYSNLATEASFRNIEPNKPFWFAESNDSLTLNGRRRVIQASNTNSIQTQVLIDTDDDNVSPFFNAENYGIIVSQNLINNGELYNNNITITNGGYHLNVANVLVSISDSNLYANVAGANAAGVVVLNASGNVTSINLTNGGKGYVESPTITISEPGAPANATAVVISEDSKYGGNALCRYITRKVTLADGFDSGDLRVTVRGIRPQGTDIIVFYKVQSSTDSRSFSDVRWKRMYLENDIYSPDFKTAVDYRFNPSDDPRINKLSYVEDNITYPLGGTFKHFAIKIVLLAECGCAAPIVRNLRAVALPEG